MYVPLFRGNYNEDRWFESIFKNKLCIKYLFREVIIAGWSSWLAREAHNLKVVRSSRTPATINIVLI